MGYHLPLFKNLVGNLFCCVFESLKVVQTSRINTLGKIYLIVHQFYFAEITKERVIDTKLFGNRDRFYWGFCTSGS